MSDDAGDQLLVAADLADALGNDLHLPAIAFGVARIHAKQIAGKQCRLVTTGSGANFQKYVALVVRIARQQQGLQIAFDVQHSLLAKAHFLFGIVAHIDITQHLLGSGDIGHGRLILMKTLDDRLDVGALFGELAVLLHIAGDILCRQQ
jgi:hypothetical protein